MHISQKCIVVDFLGIYVFSDVVFDTNMCVGKEVYRYAFRPPHMSENVTKRVLGHLITATGKLTKVSTCLPHCTQPVQMSYNCIMFYTSYNCK